MFHTVLILIYKKNYDDVDDGNSGDWKEKESNGDDDRGDEKKITICATWFNHKIRNYFSHHFFGGGCRCCCWFVGCRFTIVVHILAVVRVIVKYNEFVSNEARWLTLSELYYILGWKKNTHVYRLNILKNKNRKNDDEKKLYTNINIKLFFPSLRIRGVKWK